MSAGHGQTAILAAGSEKNKDAAGNRLRKSTDKVKSEAEFPGRDALRFAKSTRAEEDSQEGESESIELIVFPAIDLH